MFLNVYFWLVDGLNYFISFYSLWIFNPIYCCFNCVYICLMLYSGHDPNSFCSCTLCGDSCPLKHIVLPLNETCYICFFLLAGLGVHWALGKELSCNDTSFVILNIYTLCMSVIKIKQNVLICFTCCCRRYERWHFWCKLSICSHLMHFCSMLV